LLQFAEWRERQDLNPDIVEMRRGLSEGIYEDGGEEDLSAVQWQSPSDTSAEEVMGEIEMFNQAMRDKQVVVTDDGGEWI
jgi:hypothetical protein